MALTLKFLRPRTAPDRPDALVIAGGGAKGISALGAIHAFRKAGRLENVKLVAGTSAGAIVAASVALKREPIELMKQFAAESYSPDLDLRNFASSFGIDSGSHVSRWIDIVLGEPRTFQSILDTTGVELVVCATNLSKRQAAYFGPNSHPTMDVATAIRMSCAIPLYFSAVKYEDDVYVDGGIVDNFCYEYIARRKDVSHPLGLTYRTSDQETPITSLEQYIVALVQCATVQQHVRDDANVLQIDCGSTGVFAFKKTQALRSLFRTGAVQARDWIKKRA